MRRFFAVALTMAVGGCFSPKYTNGSVQCQSGSHPCPDGYHCALDNTCWKNGQDPSPNDMPSGGGDLDMGSSPDIAQPPVLTYPPAAVWTSCGGGSPAAASGTQLNFSVCPSIIGGTSTSPNGSTTTFGFFSNDIYQ